VKTSNNPLTQIARDLGIADSTLHHWRQLFSEHGEQAFPGSGHQMPLEEEIRQLKRENEVLGQERAILNKAQGIFSRGRCSSWACQRRGMALPRGDPGSVLADGGGLGHGGHRG
jgi:transposase